MAKQLTVTAAGGSMTANLSGAWELRAGSQDTTEWLARGGTYPGGGVSTEFGASQADAATGYDPAPKIAIILLATVANSNTVTLSGGATSILGAFVSNGDAAVAQGVGVNHRGLVCTMETDGAVATAQLVVFYN